METDKDNRLSMISHDLKSPMIGILGLSRLMAKEMEKEKANTKWIDLANRINSSGQQVVNLIEDILTLAKMEAGHDRIEPYRIEDLKSQFDSVLSTFELEAKAKNIRLSLNVQDAPGSVYWDMHRLRLHVFNNLLSNALKFTPSGGEVTLSVVKNVDIFYVMVEDTGPGIPEDEMENIFRAYEQVKVTSHRVSKGAGLGLHNARLFTTRHGGRIYAQNREDPVGARFLVCLPKDAIRSATDQQ